MTNQAKNQECTTEAIEELKALILSLPENRQRVLCWLIQNFDLAEEICKNSNLTIKQITEYKEKAVQDGDEIMLILAYLTEFLKKRENSDSE